MSEMETVRAFKLGECQITPDDFSIQFEGQEKQSLQPKFIEVLSYLAKHHPRVIPREELIENIWGPDSFVGEKSLTNAIWHLRKNLTSAESKTEVIETIRKAGYRLLVTPQWSHLETALTDTSTTALPQHNKLNGYFFYGIASLVITLILVFFYKDILINEPEKISQITIHPGSELFPAASPDGRYLVYSQESTNKPTNLFMKDTLQPQLPAQQLTFDNASEGHSVWSNDGQYLYFSRKDKSKKYCQYIQLKVTSRQEREIANCPLGGGYYYVDISSDDKTLAVYDYTVNSKNSGIYFLDLTQLDNHSILQSERFSCSDNCGYKDRDMAFSPDGKHLIVSRRYNRFSENIYLVNIESKATTQLTYGEEDIAGMSWHPDGNKIVYAAVRAGNRHGFILNVKDRTTQELNLTGFSYPSFAKKSKQLFYQQRIENDDIASLELNSTIASSPFPVIQSSFNHFSPDYNEKNDRFAYISNESGFNELWSAKPDGSERKQLTQLKQVIRFPKWSHDGTQIAFLSSLGDSEGDNIYIYSLKNQKLSLLKSPFSKHNRPSWSWDSSKIISAIYGKEFTDIFSIDIESGMTERLTFDGGRYGVMTSDKSMLYTKLKRGLWQKNIGSTQAPIKVVDGEDFNTLYAWSYDKKGVYFHKEFSDHQQIIFYDFNTRTNKPLVRLPLHSFASSYSLAFVSSQDKLFYTRSSFPQTDIKMVANSPLLK